MSAAIQSRLKALENASSPIRRCWIVPIRTGESPADALLSHERDPDLAGHAFVMLPLKRDEVLA